VVGSSQESSTVIGSSQGTFWGENLMNGIEAVLKVEEDLRRDRESKEALVDALLAQEILSSVLHYFASFLYETF
jgi:hypothetical protein